MNTKSIIEKSGISFGTSGARGLVKNFTPKVCAAFSIAFVKSIQKEFAFNIEDNANYEAVYFRPFNFLAKEATRRSHMLQYICQPKYTWRELRTTRTGEFENEIKTPPNPEDWFHLKIEVGEKEVRVYVNNSKVPDLVVERLTEIKSDTIGLWVGNGSSGKFKGLKINN